MKKLAAFLLVLPILLLGSATLAKQPKPPKVLVCHHPPDNPAKFKIISIGQSAVPDHLAHGDNVVGPELCDGVDNDCDGVVDDDPTDIGSACTAGVGECEAAGTEVCDRGSLTCDAVPGDPSDETCNGLDDDCDGTVDEDSMCACPPCGVGTSFSVEPESTLGLRITFDDPGLGGAGPIFIDRLGMPGQPATTTAHGRVCATVDDGVSIQFHAGSFVDYDIGTDDNPGFGAGYYFPFRDAMDDVVMPPGGISTQSQLGFQMFLQGGNVGYSRIFDLRHDFGSTSTGMVDGGSALLSTGGTSYLAGADQALMAVDGWQDVWSPIGAAKTDLSTPPFPSPFAGNTVTWDGTTMTVPLTYDLGFVNDTATFHYITSGQLVLEPCGTPPSDLFLSEYVEGSSFNKALEIYNGTGAAVDLAAGGYDVQIYFNGSTSPLTTIPLSGVVADGDVFVLSEDSADAAVLAVADQISGSLSFNGNDAVVLRKGGTVVDSFGQVGVDPGTEWSGGGVGAMDSTLRRKASVCAGDTNESDAFDPSVEWNEFAVNTFDGIGAHASTCP